jgi:heavy metal efflux system protein
MVADVSIRNGAFMIYHEGGRRYIPIKFSVRGRDLASAIQDLQSRLETRSTPQRLRLHLGRRVRQPEEGAAPLADHHPRQPRRHLPLALHPVPHLARRASSSSARSPSPRSEAFSRSSSPAPRFSISAAVGFTSLTGVATLGAVVFLSGIRRAQREEGLERGLEKGCIDEMRPVVMACMAAGIGLLPAAVASSIGAQAQQPLARVVVGGMITTVFAFSS